ncbi:Clp protease N-terminal domain-containing protein [Streptomyces sp. AK02-01A]|uniref:Clp protease N-terminal domain-containing protein n=1 Tax=Streptomyces sp. AK02-01A TaxID=3028648 RepID=UPI0029B3D38D|nr:Clp protease N-terminal domain-containing protein [Streptomyces sp. AK02-01A]MDX3852084.1 Clp protease N-terminal domain-containing protein [Streptomyces sp. AK02-01A]
MFERFTDGARGVVTGAAGHSERTGADEITEEHMLLALLDQEGTRASFALASLGIGDRRESLVNALAEARRRGGLSTADADALAGIGIDLGEIVSKVEEAHGEGALLAGGRPKRWWPGRRGFSPAAKGTLEKALRIAAGRRDRHIGAEHILLALTARPGVVAEVLADHGATYGTVERAVFGVARAG